MKPRKPIPRISDRRRAELAEYKKMRIAFLAVHPICQIWLVENGWEEAGNQLYIKRGMNPPITADQCKLYFEFKAPLATDIHHTNKRRDSMLNQTEFWLALCRKNHSRVERNKAWARANGYLLNF